MDSAPKHKSKHSRPSILKFGLSALFGVVLIVSGMLLQGCETDVADKSQAKNSQQAPQNKVVPNKPYSETESPETESLETESPPAENPEAKPVLSRAPQSLVPVATADPEQKNITGQDANIAGEEQIPLKTDSRHTEESAKGKIKQTVGPITGQAITETKLSAAPQKTKAKIAIVIDDLGYQVASAKKLAQLPYPLTLAVIPGSPYAQNVAKIIKQQQQEFILHVPMQTMNTEKWEKGLNIDSNKTVFIQQLEQMLIDFPGIKGINNHGGSLLTANRERMDWVMEILFEYGLFFLDSRTTSESVAIDSAEQHAVPRVSRDVFLDNERDEAAISKAFDRLREVALKHGHAVAIGHPHAVTIAQLKKQLPLLVEEGFQIAFCSELLIAANQRKEPKNTIVD